MTLARLIPLAAAAKVFTSAPAVACRSANFLQALLLQSPPPLSERETIAARVEVVRLLEPSGERFGRPGPRRAVMRVLQPIRGVQRGSELIVPVHITSCGPRSSEYHVGARGYVAGSADPETGTFTGLWRTHGELRRAR